MGIFSGLFRSRDKPKDSYDSTSYSYFFGRTHAGKRVNDRTAMQIIAVYACVRVLSEAIAQLPLHVYQYTDNGKERVPKECAHIEVFQNNYKQRPLQQAIKRHTDT